MAEQTILRTRRPELVAKSDQGRYSEGVHYASVARQLLNYHAGVAQKLFIPTHKGQGLPASEIASLPTRSGSMKNPSYAALTPQSFTDFDWLAVLDSTAYNRGGDASTK